MAALGELPATTASPLPNLNTSYDPDFDSFLNLDQTQSAFPTSESMKTNPSIISQPSMSTSDAGVSDFGQPFSAPSHQYGDHQQQTGLPPGAVAHAMTFNDNSMPSFGAVHPGFSMGDDPVARMKQEETAIDFGSVPSRSHSEMDLENDTPHNMPYLVPTAPARAQQFVDPHVLGGNDFTSPMGPPATTPAPQAGRMYPGMHQQQAAMARRAQQQQRQQSEIMRQQQHIRQHTTQQVATPTPQPAQNRPVRNVDPMVEERISRLLQQMRQNSTSQDSANTPSALPQMSKPKKDEDDMDEDERLLASEEGKKLTSKERRQLRNKVSARAFRSRRKEYIGQLEGEVAVKTTEANELRMQNRALLEENNRLTDLTRLLFSSPHFSDFLNDLSTNGLPAQLQSSQQTPRQQQQQHQLPQQQQQQMTQLPVSQAPVPSNVHNETNSHMGGQEFAPQQQQNFQVGMVMVPDQRMDMYASGWNSGIDMNFNPSVFAVLEVPEGPVLDAEMLSGKSLSSIHVPSDLSSSKDEAPQLDRPPVEEVNSEVSSKPTSDSTIEIDESDPSLALFSDDSLVSSSAPCEVCFESITLEKPSRYSIVVEGDESTDAIAASVRTFERLCAVKLALLQGLGRLAFPGTPLRIPRASSSSPASAARIGCISHRLYLRNRASSSESNGRRGPFSSANIFPVRSLSDPTLKYYVVPGTNNRINTRKIESRSPSGFDPKPMKYWYQALSAPTADTPGSTFILCYPNRKYVFGHAAEGLQRTFTERAQSFTNLTEFFITGKTSWDNIGGMLGMILTLADARASSATSLALEREEKRVRQQQNQSASQSKSGTEEGPGDRYEPVTIHGGKNIAHTLGTARRFIFRKQTPIQVQEYESEFLMKEEKKGNDPFAQPTWSDENIKVWAMPLKSTLDYKPKSPLSSGFGSKSPLKRSLDDFAEVESQTPTASDIALKNRMLRDNVVRDMFESTWKIDALHEENLKDLKSHTGVIFVRNPVTKDIERYNGPRPGSSQPVPDMKVLVRKPWPAALVEKLPHTTPAKESLCYIVRGHDQRGKFDRAKAVALGVPAGPAFAELAKGVNFTNEEGKVITPEMVLGPSRGGRGVAFIEIPSLDFIEDFISRAEWNSKAVTSGLSVFVWILGPGVGNDNRIREFMKRMEHCKHVMSSTDYCPNQIAMQTAAKSALRLASINKDNFVVPYHDNITLPQPGTNPQSSSLSSDGQPWITSQPGLILDIEPNFKINRAEVVTTFNPLHEVNRMPRAVQQRLDKIKSQIRKPFFIDKLMDMRYQIPALGAEAEVFTLGTGSSSPSKYRNVSATLLHVPKKGYYLFDAGENTLGQLKRTFGPEQLQHVMQNLRLIWISHLHADHHLGTATVIKEWYKEYKASNHSARSTIGSITNGGVVKDMLQQKRLCVVGESAFIQWLEEYAGVEDYGFGSILPLSVHPKEGLKTELSYRHSRVDGSYPEGGLERTTLTFEGGNTEFSGLLQEATGLRNLSAVWVNHCKGAMAVTLAWEDNFKVSYSGDCRPSSNFVKIGKGSTLLIHEATFQDDMKGSAIAKKHCTTSEAIQVGRLMRAHMTLLTHFSQRYAKISKAGPESSNLFQKEKASEPSRDLDVPDSEDLADREPGLGGPGDLTKVEDYNMPVCIAYDYMKVKIRDIPIAQMFSPAFEKLVQRIDQAAIESELEKKKTDERSRELNKKKQKERESRKKSYANKANQGKNSPSRPSTPTSPAEPAETIEARKPSAWSASESESGWSASESEDEDVARK
ncbi:ribonuclease Z [Talaromyces islandicus]|uniref:ribonuclease Z n=1 Tax=Talaromyces islandicus TaxID=28573 RepID=A0A0U1M1S7_TALIS|nr:ribonuclease Z [Talaromyces islandicus]